MENSNKPCYKEFANCTVDETCSVLLNALKNSTNETFNESLANCQANELCNASKNCYD
jgi:hypothetical protein